MSIYELEAILGYEVEVNQTTAYEQGAYAWPQWQKSSKKS